MNMGVIILGMVQADQKDWSFTCEKHLKLAGGLDDGTCGSNCIGLFFDNFTT